MKNKTILLIVAVNLAILVLLSIFFPHLMISPGDPIKAHSELATDCFACHSAFIGSTSQKCITCHKVSEIGLKTTQGIAIDKEKKNVAFHQKLIENDCVACHSEHKGVQPFRPIGQFSHELLEDGVQNQCNSCHTSPGDALHSKLTGNCNSCHSQDGWAPATFDHKQYFRFDRHHDTDCVTCHIDNNYESYTCYGCHEHSRSNIRGEHIEEGIYEYENCEECHRSGDEDEAEYLWKLKRFGGKNPQPYRYNRHYEDDDD